MHGVTKADLQGLSAEKAAARAKKTEQYKMLAAEVLRRRAGRIYDEKSLGMTNKFLEVNPECYTVWNFRREMLNKTFAASAEAERWCGWWHPVPDTGGGAAEDARFTRVVAGSAPFAKERAVCR